MHEIAIEHKRSSTRFASERPTRTHSRIALPPTHLRATLRSRSRWSSLYNPPVHSLSHTHEMLGGKSASLTAHSCPGPPPYKASSLAGEGTVMVPTARQGSW